ncbi:hypothetical protein CHLRE_02g109300v5 [Chlamydomonas reinhardtii]|uniref:Reverse transcriptase domain-containing protein n=1 Tax=Chlamydomonas reinhardtii TaxID=3055 RepID=A0A2K3E2V1_CHLRE|nr:uncharacterized protein CHLRE_02g109300v5 [Chlamydomonas reinhardtii]PNW87106.1 hypothetical protein CHLRE_02g109300v5 [Chlamydomonas reinhardtii]
MHAALTQQNTTLAQAGISQLQYDVTKDAAYYAITMKMHKTPPGLRFLACSHACPVTAISDVVTASLRTLADAFRDMWRDRIGTDPWFCLHSGAVMDSVYAFNAQQLPRSSVTAPQAFDFARLYTNIPHAELADTMASLITATLAHAQRVAIAVTVTPPKTPDGRRKYDATLLTSDAAHNAPAYRRDPMTDVAVHTFTRDQFLVLFRSLVCSTFIRFGTFALVRQTCGIPMGISAAPFIANLFLAWFEYRFLTQPAATAQRQRVLHAFDLTKRYLDDLLALNNPFITRLLSVDQRYAGLHGLYPASLQVEAQSHPHLQAQLAAGTAAMPFLDILLILRTTPAGHARITTRLYDKRVQPVFDGVRLSRFIGTDSNVNEASKRNIFTGQFHRLRRVVTEVENFAFETANLITALTRMGYRRPRLLGDLQRMLQRTPEAYYVQRRQRHRPEYADLVGLTRQYLAGRRHFDSTASPVELAQSHYW